MKESEFELETILELKDKTVRNYLNYHKDISKEEEKKTLRELFKLKKEGNKEDYINKRNELSRNYLKYLILKSKKSYLKDYGKVPLEDYISESYLGLLKAFEKFDASKYDNGFLAYGDFYIENNLRRINLQKYGLSSFHYKEFINILKGIKSFMEINHIEDIKNIKDIYLKEIIKETLNLTSDYKIQQKLIFFRPYLEGKSSELSLEFNYKNEENENDYNLKDNLVNETDFYKEYSKKEIEKDITKLILNKVNHLLKDNERLIGVFKMRFNYLSKEEIKELALKYKGKEPDFKEDRERYTLQEIGSLFGVTRERVRQLEEKIFELIKSDEEINNLKELMKD